MKKAEKVCVIMIENEDFISKNEKAGINKITG